MSTGDIPLAPILDARGRIPEAAYEAFAEIRIQVRAREPGDRSATIDESAEDRASRPVVVRYHRRDELRRVATRRKALRTFHHVPAEVRSIGGQRNDGDLLPV